MITLILNNHRIEVHNSILGKETIRYDGDIVSQKSTTLGGIHSFIVDENGESIQYEIEIGNMISLTSFVSYTIRRNGKLVFTNK